MLPNEPQEGVPDTDNSTPVEVAVVAGADTEQNDWSIPVDEPQPEATVEQPKIEVAVEVKVDNTVYRANAKVDPKLPIREPLPENKKALNPADSMSLLYSSAQQITETVDRMRETPSHDPASMIDWLSAVRQSDNFTPMLDDDVGYAAWREGSEWRQFIEYEGARLRVGTPKLGDAMTGHMLSGEAALLRVQSRLGMGTHVQIPLWNSGIWVTIKPPHEDAFLELQERIALEKITLGRASRGLVFDNYQVYTMHHVMEFIYRHITATTLKFGQEGMEAALDEAILITDIPNLLLGVLCTMYPHGYELTQPCTADISKCTEVFQGLIGLPKIGWVDVTRFNDNQRRHMANRRSDSMTMAEVKAFQEQFPSQETSVVKLRSGINIVLEVPNMARYRDSGQRWVDAIETDTARSFGTNLQGQAREEYMFNQAIISSLGAYSHWYKQIVILGDNDDDQIIVDRVTLEATAKTLSADREVVFQVEKAIKRFNDYASCTIVGIVNFECPKCKQTQLRPDAPNQVIIPIDVISTFFTLLSKRLEKILM